MCSHTCRNRFAFLAAVINEQVGISEFRVLQLLVILLTNLLVGEHNPTESAKRILISLIPGIYPFYQTKTEIVRYDSEDEDNTYLCTPFLRLT